MICFRSNNVTFLMLAEIANRYHHDEWCIGTFDTVISSSNLTDSRPAQANEHS
jgi:hypothetical protein